MFYGLSANHSLGSIPFVLRSADSEPFSYSPLTGYTVPAASSHSSVFPTLTGAAGDNFSLSSDSSAGKSVWRYCLTWLSLTGIFGTIFLCFESVIIAFCPAGWPTMLNQVQKWQLVLLACSSPCGCRNKGGAASRDLIKHSEAVGMLGIKKLCLCIYI